MGAGKNADGEPEGPERRKAQAGAGKQEFGNDAFENLRRKSAQAHPGQKWIVFGVCVALAVLWLVKFFSREREQPVHLHPSYEEALRVLRNDDLEPTEERVRLVLELIRLATSEDVDESGFKTVTPGQLWPDVNKTVSVEEHTMALRPFPRNEINMSVLEDFITADEAAHILQLAESRFVDSTCGVNGEDTDGICAGGFRQSQSTTFQRVEQDEVLKRIERRAAHICGVKNTNVEPIQVARYKPGGRYKPHFDTDGPNHRWWTILVYLNSMEGKDGGQTRFPMLKTSVRPRLGLAVYWKHIKHKRRIYYSLHDAAPVTSGTKYVMQLWVHKKRVYP
eukprot:TRINITY_DN104185_c0_g1_i1.p1 TRINITY_DN104185_c0_g1~~TRINITY_DN104185_c0_g1_i1.p1  ORF type:complete len:336 (+),score=57.49 TRINITY_DN104185_c0_g1_i1:53-1060(+)